MIILQCYLTVGAVLMVLGWAYDRRVYPLGLLVLFSWLPVLFIAGCALVGQLIDERLSHHGAGRASGKEKT